ncbi:MAG: DUF3343 domain-containing protein [Thermodesulfobacteriota bacterium]|nr:DUF3343 domain-containing protein [Thermodesulfobacteriota bacterium]
MKMIDNNHLLIVFNSIHRVMLAELSLQLSYDILLMPVPRAISADCGMVLRFERDDYDGIIETLKSENLMPFLVYRLGGRCRSGFELIREFS